MEQVYVVSANWEDFERRGWRVGVALDGGGYMDTFSELCAVPSNVYAPENLIPRLIHRHGPQLSQELRTANPL